MKKCLWLGLLIAGLTGSRAAAEEGQIVTVNGNQYRETTVKQKRQVVELQPQTRTYQQTQYKPVQQTVTKSVVVPITEYRWELQPKSSWNPFAQPEWEYKYVPQTRWEQRTEQVPVTVMKAEVVEVQVTEQVPVARLVDVDVKTRVAMNPTVPGIPGTAAGTNSQIANAPWNTTGRVSLDGQPTATLTPLNNGTTPPSAIGQRETRLDWKR